MLIKRRDRTARSGPHPSAILRRSTITDRGSCQMSQTSRRALLAGAAMLTVGAAAAQDQKSAPQPVEGDKGAPILGPRNPPREAQNPDLLQPPSTDHGSLPNLRFSYADAHVK